LYKQVKVLKVDKQNFMMKINSVQANCYRFTNHSGIYLQIGLGLLLSLLLASLSPIIHPAFASDIASGGDVSSSASLPALRDFVMTIKSGDPRALVGVYVPGLLALPIVQQPGDAPGYVSTQPGVATQFRMAKDYGTDALLAHNYLSGNLFFELEAGQRVVLIYGDGRVRFYEIKERKSYQAISPNSPYSNFIDLDNPGTVLSAADVFLKNFGIGSQLVFQTCIESAGVESWGRLFVKAEPIRRRIAQGMWASRL
jgi:hypothetical protein